MFKILDAKTGACVGMTEAPNYIKRHENGCLILCPELDAQGISFAGKEYHLLGRPDLEGADTVSLEEIDAGTALAETNATLEVSNRITGQMSVATQLFVRATTDISDDAALKMPDLFLSWAEALAAGSALQQGTIINDGGTLYRVVQAGGITPQEHQPPHGEGMLAVYRPIDAVHSGTQEDPIPWVFGIDCASGKYYSYNGAVYLCKVDMPACVWAPGSAGLWQWEEA